MIINTSRENLCVLDKYLLVSEVYSLSNLSLNYQNKNFELILLLVFESRHTHLESACVDEV